jgi:uncharacterized protein (TIGR00251 family)
MVSAFVQESKEGVTLKVRVQPRSSRDEVVGPHQDAVKIRITAAPVAGRANTHLLKFLAKRLKIPRTGIVVQSGAASRTKTIAIQGMSASEVQERLGLAKDL